MRWPGGMSKIRYTRSVFTRALQASFSLSFPRKRLHWEKKIVVPCFDVIMIAFFPRNLHWSSLFAWKARVNQNKRVPPGHPIILLKSNKFNMDAVSVKKGLFFKCWLIFLESNSRKLYRSSGKGKEKRCLRYTSSTKREFRHFHVVVLQWRQRNVQRAWCTCKVAVLPFPLMSLSSCLNSLIIPNNT